MTDRINPDSWRRFGLFGAALVLVVSFFSFYGVIPSSAATNVLTAPFNECPSIGNDSGCAYLIILNAASPAQVVANPSVGPYNSHNDSLVGIVNNSGATVNSVALASTKDIFAFDGDGICATDGHGNLLYSWSGTGQTGQGASDCPFLPAMATTAGYDGFDYAGPNTSFSNFSSADDYHSGNVNFPAGLADGSSTYFSLENILCASGLSFPASFNVTKTTTSLGVTAGSTTPIDYTLSAQNLGAVVGNVTVTDAAPAGTSYVADSAQCSAVVAPETCTVADNGGTLTWTLTNVPGGASATLTFSVTVPIGYASPTVGNTASWSGPGCATSACSTNSVSTPVTPASFTLTYNAETGGSVNGNTLQTVDYGLNGTAVTAVASPGYYFTGWSDSDANAGRTDDDITSNLTVTADFAPLTSSVSTWVWANGGPVTGDLLAGVVVSDSASISVNQSSMPGGTVTFTLYSGGWCNLSTGVASGGTATADSPITVPVSGGSATSGNFAPLSPGRYYFVATYSGDGNYPAATGPCEPIRVCPAPESSTSTTVNANGSPIGTGPIKTEDSITDTANVTGNEEATATGMVTFTLYSGGSCDQGVGSGGTQVGSPFTASLDMNGSATSSTFKWLAPGTYYFEATYLGDGIDPPSNGPCEPFIVVPCPEAVVTTTVWSGANVVTTPLAQPATVTDEVNVAGNQSETPTGNVTFTLYAGGSCNNGQIASNGTQVGTSSTGPIDGNGDATSPTFSGLNAGNYYFVVSYAGDGVYPSSTGNCEPFTVCPPPQSWTTTVVNSNGAPIVATTLGIGASVSDTATVTDTGNNNPTGSVEFTLYVGGTCNGQGPGSGGTVVGTDTEPLDASGSATSITFGPLSAPGSYYFVGVYSGSGAASYPGSTGNCEPFSVSSQSTTTTSTTSSSSTTSSIPFTTTSMPTTPTTVNGSTTTTSSTPTSTTSTSTPASTTSTSSPTSTTSTTSSTSSTTTTSTMPVTSTTMPTTPSGTTSTTTSSTTTSTSTTTSSVPTISSTTTFISGPPTTPPHIPPATIPSGAPGTGLGGSATSSINGGALIVSILSLFFGIAGLGLVLRRRRRA